MGKTKSSATGRGYLGELVVHRISGQVGVVVDVVEARAGWPPQLTIKLQDGSFRKGNLSEFKDASPAQKSKFTTSPGQETAGSS